MAVMKMAEIATKINAHLKRMEASPRINKKIRVGKRPTEFVSTYYQAAAWAAGRYVMVSYVTYQGSKSLSRAEAMYYLDWLDNKNSGTHWMAFIGGKR